MKKKTNTFGTKARNINQSKFTKISTLYNPTQKQNNMNPIHNGKLISKKNITQLNNSRFRNYT